MRPGFGLDAAASSSEVSSHAKIACRSASGGCGAPGGATTDVISDGAIQSGEIGAYLQMRDTILPQAQTQLDEFANQMSQALSNKTVSGTATTVSSTAASVQVLRLGPRAAPAVALS